MSPRPGPRRPEATVRLRQRAGAGAVGTPGEDERGCASEAAPVLIPRMKKSLREIDFKEIRNYCEDQQVVDGAVPVENWLPCESTENEAH